MADQDPVAWNVDLEVSLFHAMKKHKPVGVNRHFQMAFIYSILNSSINRRISCKQIWEKLSTLYDLQALNESEISPFPNKLVDFSLPETEFSMLMAKVASSSKSPVARHEHVKDQQKDKEHVKESHKEKDRDSHREKDSHKDKERHREKDRDSYKDSHRDKDSHKEKDRDSHKERESLRDKHEREKESAKSDKKSRKDRDKDRHRDRSSSKSKRERERDSSPKGSRKRTRNIPDPVPKLKDEGAPTPKRARRV